jgi:hypothetical protein
MWPKAYVDKVVSLYCVDGEVENIKRCEDISGKLSSTKL